MKVYSRSQRPTCLQLCTLTRVLTRKEARVHDVAVCVNFILELSFIFTFLIICFCLGTFQNFPASHPFFSLSFSAKQICHAVLIHCQSKHNKDSMWKQSMKSSLSEPLDVLYEDGTFYKTEPYEVFQKLNLRFQEDSFSTM